MSVCPTRAGGFTHPGQMRLHPLVRFVTLLAASLATPEATSLEPSGPLARGGGGRGKAASAGAASHDGEPTPARDMAGLQPLVGIHYFPGWGRGPTSYWRYGTMPAHSERLPLLGNFTSDQSTVAMDEGCGA